MDKNLENWQQIYAQGLAGSYMRYPNENLVSLFFQNKSRINLAGTCLDYGFGSASNSEFLIQQMATLHGVEIAQSSVDIARQRLAPHKNFDPSLFVVRQDLSGWEESFDLVVAWQVLCYNDLQGMKGSVRELHASLKPGGVLITTLTTQRDVKAKFAAKVAPNTFVIDDRIPHQQGCQVFAVDDKNEFLSFFEQFEVLDAGHYERSSFLAENTLSEHYLVAQKR
jgi:SAM-dependent methyltransferase